MGRSREEVVRFAVGGPDEPRSAVWRLWTGKDTSDVYISARTLGGVHKVSLHQSGVWRFAFTDEYWRDGDAPWVDEGDRLIESWDPPQPIQGVTSAFMVIVPSAELGTPRRPLPESAKKHTKDVIWVRPAPEGSATHFMVMYTEPGEPVPGTEVEILANFSLPEGRMVSVAVFEHAISTEQQRQIETSRRAIAEGMRQASSEAQAAYQAALEPRGCLYGYNEFGTRFFIDIAGSPILDTD